MSVNPLPREHRGLNDSVHAPLSKMDAVQEANRCLFCYDAPCTKACPTHIDVPAFIKKISTDNLLGSAKVIMSSNPVGASCARVCPTEQLCEGACVLGDETSPIRIGDLQRYATDWAREQDVHLFAPGEPTGKTVAVIGGGPAGLSAARELARYGHQVTIYEAKEELGGLNTYGIVPFRLEKDIALWEAEQVTALGVEVKVNTRVGRDVSGEEILGAYDAIILTVGMGNVPKLGIEGEDLAGVHDAIAFIESAKALSDLGDLGNHVAVIGAGNTAIDAATCSIRLGVPRVTMYYRRTEREMSAYDFEYAFAKQEGVEFRFLTVPKRILGEDGRVSAIEFMQTELLPSNDSVKGVLVVKDGTEHIEPVSSVVLAIGQERFDSLFEEFGLAVDGGVPIVDGDLRTSKENVFAAGDCIFKKGNSDAMVVEAAEQGMRVAIGVHTYLMNKRP